jgi:Lar family restriction alleviation protein
MEKLKPCPFCGGDAKLKKVDELIVDMYFVCCGNTNCQTYARTAYQATKEMAVKVWNRRAT